MEPTVLIVLLVVLLFLVALRPLRIVPEYERIVVLAFGRYAGTRGPGITFIIPGMERGMMVDMREKFLEIPRQTAITRDNAPIAIDFLVYYRRVDPKRSVLAVDNVVSASLNMATTTLRAVIGDIELDSVLAKREQINDTLRTKLDEVTERWGLKITGVEIREIDPPKDVQTAMNRQMTAERERRAMVTQADGAKQAAITVAEGEKTAAILRAEGQKQSAILQAEGERQAQELRAQGFAMALQAIYSRARHIDDKTMALQYLETLRAVGASPSTKFVVPMELTSLMHQFISTMTGAGNGAPQLDGQEADGADGGSPQ